MYQRLKSESTNDEDKDNYEYRKQNQRIKHDFPKAWKTAISDQLLGNGEHHQLILSLKITQTEPYKVVYMASLLYMQAKF